MSAQASQAPCKHRSQSHPSPDALPASLFVCGRCGSIQRLDLSRYGRRATDDVRSRLSDCGMCGSDRYSFEPIGSSL